MQKTKFKETRYSVSKTIPYYIFEEGIGGSGYYEVDVVIDVRKNGEHYDATVSAKARTNAGRFGKAIFSCTAISYANGTKRDEKKLQGGVNAVENVGWCNLGAATIILPPYETNVEIGRKLVICFILLLQCMELLMCLLIGYTIMYGKKWVSFLGRYVKKS